MRRVVKIGGSLLLRSRLRRDFNAWLSSQSPAQTLVIVGGGELVDAIRNLDQVRSRDSAVVHWCCVDLLQTTFQFLRDWFDDWHLIETAEGFQDHLDAGFPVDRPTLINVRSFYRPDCDHGLPHDWRTTTDAIAAALAIQTFSDELVLLKSCEPDDSLSLQQLAATGIVDAALLPIAGQVNRIRVQRLGEINEMRSENRKT